MLGVSKDCVWVCAYLDDVEKYIQSFSWMDSRFPIDRPLTVLSAMIQDKMKATDLDLKKNTD